jgi:hypothetical protein
VEKERTPGSMSWARASTTTVLRFSNIYDQSAIVVNHSLTGNIATAYEDTTEITEAHREIVGSWLGREDEHYHFCLLVMRAFSSS